MELVEESNLPVLEPFDHVALPQRPRPVQQRNVEVSDHFHQLVPGPGSRECDRSDVIVEVDVVDRHPVGESAEPEGGSAVERSDRRSCAERVDDASGEVRTGFSLRRVEQHQHAGVGRARL